MSTGIAEATAECTRAPSAAGPIFVVGAPRSGTSLLRNVLNRHPSIGLCDETYFFYYAYQRRRAFGDLADPKARQRLVESYLAISRVRRFRIDLDGLADVLMREGETYPAFFAALLRFYAAAYHKARYGEKTPQHALVAETLCDWYPDCKLIHLVRDPRDVVESLLRMPWASPNARANARVWLQHVHAAERCRQRRNYLQVRYEDLVAEPEAELMRVCAFLGEEFSSRMVAADDSTKADAWWFARAQGRVTMERRGIWERQLTPEQVSIIEDVAGPEMRRLGYEPVSPAPGARRALAAAGEAVDAVRQKVSQLPHLWYRWVRPTQLAAEEAWIDRRSQVAADQPATATRLTPRRSSARTVAIRLFLTCWMLYVLHFATNTVREIYPALSLGDHLSFDVSEYAGFHPDIFEIPGRGAFINNNPGASILGAIPYALARPVIDRVVERVQQSRAASPDDAATAYHTIYPMAREFYRKARARGLDIKFGLAAGVMQALCMAPLSALSAVVMFYVLASLIPSQRWAAALAFLYAIGTPVFYRTAQLNQNLLVSHCAFFAFVLLWRPWDAPAAPRRPHYFLAGLLCGWAVVCDYSGLVVVVVLSLYGLVRRRALPAQARSSGDAWRFAGGVLLCGAVLMWYQWVCFGNPFYPAQHYMPPAHYTDRGYAGMDWPQLDLLWATAFNMRYGLFISAPLLLLALYPPAWFDSRTRLLGRRELWCIGAFCALFFLFCSANQYGRMQFNSGVRHVVPVSPFLFLVAAGVLVRMPGALRLAVAIPAAYWSWCLAMYRDVEQGLGVPEAPIHITLGGLRLPWLETLQGMGYANSQTVALPLLAVFGVIVWLLWGVGRPLTAGVWSVSTRGHNPGSVSEPAHPEVLEG